MSKLGKKLFIVALIGLFILFGIVYATDYIQKKSVGLQSPEIDSDEELSALESDEKLTLTGSLETIVYDEEIPHYEYFIDSNGKKTQVWLDDPVFLGSGTPVTVTGQIIDGKFMANAKDLEIFSPLLAPPNRRFVGQPTPNIPETIGEQRTAVILIKFNDSTTLPFTPQQINDSIFNNGLVNKFILENSFGQTWLKGNVYGWYSLNDNCNGGRWGRAGWVEVQEAIDLSDRDINFLNIDRIIIISDAFCESGPNGYASVGKAILNSSDGLFNASYVNLRNSVFFYEKTRLPSGPIRGDGFTSGIGMVLHELGHNFGAWHSNSLDCSPSVLARDCLAGNYGNIYDVMGKGWITGTQIGYSGNSFEMHPHAAFHYGGIMKKEFKWVKESNVINITRNGTYILRPLEKSQATIGKISLPSYPYYPPYLLEYRVPFGYDKFLNDPVARNNLGGILINRQYRDSMVGWVPQQSLLDMNPTSSTDPFDKDWYDVALNAGEVFFDNLGGIKITNVSEDMSNPNDPKLSFYVEFYPPVCERNTPIVNIDIRSGNSYVGGNRGITLNLTDQLDIFVVNQDGMFICTDSTFQFTENVSMGWTSRFNQPNVTIAPGSRTYTRTNFFEIDIPANALVGDYNASIKATNVQSGLSSEASFRIRVI